MSDIYHILRFARGSSKIYSYLKNFFVVRCLWDRCVKEKYYKGTDDPLYFPYIPHNDLKVCPKIKIPYYYGLKSDDIIFDEFPLPDWAKERDPSMSGKLSGISVKKL